MTEADGGGWMDRVRVGTHGNGGAESIGFLSPANPRGGSTSTLCLHTCRWFVTVQASSGPQANWKSPRFSQDPTPRQRKQRPRVDTQEPLRLLSGWEECLLDVCPSPAALEKVFSIHTAFTGPPLLLHQVQNAAEHRDKAQHPWKSSQPGCSARDPA